MPNLLRSGSAWLATARRVAAADPVTYVAGRGSVGFPVLATVGRTTDQVSGGDGLELEVQVRDYLIDAADLAAGGLAGPPRAGHRIVEADGTAYEVAPIAGEGPWRWHDSSTYRIHTKQTAPAVAPGASS